MNSIMYPYIMGEILRQIHYHSRMGQKLILLDAPTLFESRADDFCELIISVTARAELRKALDFAAGFDYRRSGTGSHGCPVTRAVFCGTLGFYH